MQKYNTLVKHFKPKNHESLRVITFSNTKKKFKDRDERLEYEWKNYRSHFESAEVAEQTKKTEKRNYKQEAIGRAKRTVKALIRNNYSPRLKMLTLTYKDQVTDRQKVLNDIKNMTKRYKKSTGDDLRYIATLEWQKKRHCLHVHLLMDSIYIDWKCWEQVYWQHGFCRVNSLTAGKSKNDVYNAIDYVLKYIQKDCTSGSYYDHLYYRSKNWNMTCDKQYTTTYTKADVVELACSLMHTGSFVFKTFTFKIRDIEEITIYDFYPKL